MYCPNCGKANLEDQKFCRACGLSLEKIVESLVEQLPPSTNQQLTDRQNKVERLLSIVGVSAVSILVLSVVYGIIFKIIIEKGAVIQGSIFLAFIVGIIAFALLAIYSDSLKKSSGKRSDQDQTSIKDKETGKLLPEVMIDPVPSVAERTTDLLMADRVRGDKDD